MNLFTKKKQSLRLRELCFHQGEEGCGERIAREFQMGMYTLLYLKWITNKDLLYSTGNLCGSLDGRGVWGRMHTCMFMAESLCHNMKLSQYCQLTPIQNKIFQEKIKKKKFEKHINGRSDEIPKNVSLLLIFKYFLAF